MNSRKHLARVALALTAIAGVGLSLSGVAGAVPAGDISLGQSGKTVITFDESFLKQFKDDGVTISSISPATSSTKNSNWIKFPITSFDLEMDDVINHSGGMKFTSTSSATPLIASDPIAHMSGGTSGYITESVSNNEVTVMLLKKIKVGDVVTTINTSGSRWTITSTTIVTAKVYVNNNASLVAQFNQVMGTDVLTPGELLGKSKSTLVDTVLCTSNSVSACNNS